MITAGLRNPRSYSRLLIPLSLIVLASTNVTLGRGFFENLGHETGSCFSGGCDAIWAINQRVDSGISSKMESAVEPIQKAIQVILTELFKNDIDPMLDRVNDLTEARLTQIDNIVQGAVSKAKAATAETIGAVKESIIDESAKQARAVSSEVLKDITCGELTTRDQVQSFIDNNFRLFGSIRDAMHDLVDECAAGVDRNNYWTVYSGLKCEYEIKIGNARTVGEMQNYYHAFLEETSKAECVLLDDTNKSEARNDQRLYTKRLNIWNLALR